MLEYAPQLFSLSGDVQLEGLAWERIANGHLDAGKVEEAQKATRFAVLFEVWCNAQAVLALICP